MAITPAHATRFVPAAPEAAGAPWLTWAPELAHRLQNGLPLTVLGQVVLEPPLSRLLVLGRSEGGPRGTFSLAAVVMPETNPALVLAPFGLGPLAGTLQPPAELGRYFPIRRTSEAIFVLDEVGHDRLVVGPGVVLNHLVISCGAWPLLVPLFGPRTRARPAHSVVEIGEELDRFCAVVGVAVETIYRRRGLALPPVALTLRPTALNVETALGGLRWLGRSAAGLLSLLPRVAGDLPEVARIVPAAGTAAQDGPTFDDVGGLEEAKRELQTVCLAIRDPQAFRRWGARPPKGVLLYGPPGTGKTLLARCLAHEAGARFLPVRAADVTSKWYGEAEHRMQAIFDRARREAPSVVFFDEIDALARVRDDAHEATHRVVSTLLENMDGLQPLRGVVVVAATNRPEAVDPALTRPGRFDRLVEVPLPDRAARRAIFRVHLRQAERQAERELFAPFDEEGWRQLLDATEGFSGAEIAEAVRRALEAKVRSGAVDGQVTLFELLEQTRGIARPW
jgi:hypothetical protein